MLLGGVMSNNQKIYIAKGIYLEFKEEVSGKYSFSKPIPQYEISIFSIPYGFI